MTFYVYIVECSDGSLYTGYTNDVEARVKMHNEGKGGAKYTKSRRPVRLIYQEAVASKSEAMKREYLIKQLERKEKLALINSN